MFIISNQVAQHPLGGWEALVADCGRILASLRGVSQLLWPPGNRQMTSVGHQMAKGGFLIISYLVPFFPSEPQQPAVTSQG